jgi:hypothetical protein
MICPSGGYLTALESGCDSLTQQQRIARDDGWVSAWLESHLLRFLRRGGLKIAMACWVID